MTTVFPGATGDPSVPPAAGPEGRQPRRAGTAVGRVPAAASGRAVLGATLVVASVLALYLAWVRATTGANLALVVAARDIDPGTTLTSADLAVEEVRVNGRALQHAFSDPEELIGVTTLGPLGSGEVFQAASLIRKQGGAASLEVGLSPDLAAAVGGLVRAGDRVDVYRTGIPSEGAADTAARLLARAVPVVSIRSAGQDSGDDVQLVVAAPDRRVAAEMVAAEAADEVALVRSTGVDPGSGSGSGTDTGTGTGDPT